MPPLSLGNLFFFIYSFIHFFLSFLAIILRFYYEHLAPSRHQATKQAILYMRLYYSEFFEDHCAPLAVSIKESSRGLLVGSFAVGLEAVIWR
jgi:hypothetical protein